MTFCDQLEVILSNFCLRVLTASIFCPIALSFTWLGGIYFLLFVWSIGGFILYEWINITKEKWNFLQKILAGIFYFIVCLSFMLGASAFSIFSILIISAVLLGIISVKNIGWVSCGFLYASLPVLSLHFLRGYETLGFWVAIFLFVIVWGTDIAAYFAGRTFGGPKLAPQFSPNKTWSGAIAGTVIGVIGGTSVYFLFMNRLSIFVALLALILSIVSQISDLGQSWLKRYFFVKDSGCLLPGHGGFMDRMDGLVGASFFLYLVSAFAFDMNAPFKFFI
ncbi:Phosphatidate cytidylyltransferase [Bartonella ancashensis]|uniref:Phosphatidate cytidylyltransferase n=1 Tax=Bartonella ancashensis TaxID=1318743 RepID=A0A0M4LH44_9HYPH|nr:Phosphatidate cytidylyltransferase [Bartonella ancashensis]